MERCAEGQRGEERETLESAQATWSGRFRANASGRALTLQVLSVTFANAFFALDANGTDLNPSPEKGAEWLPEGLALLQQRLGSFPLEKLRCGVWDWGDRFTKPLHHLEEVREHYAAFDDAPSYITDGLEERIRARQA